MNNQKILKSAITAGIAGSLALTSTFGMAQGFPNVPQTPGELLAGPVGSEMGRLALIEYIGGKVVTVPERPSSPGGSDFQVRSWDFSDPRNPRELNQFGHTAHPFRAHGLIKSGNELYIGGEQNALRANGDGPLEHTRWTGPSGHWDTSGMMRPWAARSFWSYDNESGNTWLELDGERRAEWDHLGQTGVMGFPLFIGNLMIYASDQSLSGVASYDVSDPDNPVLLDVLNEGQIGSYWPDIFKHYVVLPSKEPGPPNIQFVDFSDPNNLRLHCQIDFPSGMRSDWPNYSNFQDEYAFIAKYKIDVDACEVVLEFDTDNPRPVSVNQFSMALGNLVLFGGIGRYEHPGNQAGLSVFAHQAEPDTTGPYVGYHIPRPNQTNYPVFAPITALIHETLQTETLVPGENLIIREVGGEQVDFKYVVNYGGVMTIDPLEYLKPNTTYEVQFVEGGIKDAANNGMQGYTWRFSTGSDVSGLPTPDPEPGPEPSPEPEDPDNAAPIIGAFTTLPASTVELGTEVQVSIAATDPDNDALEYRFNLADGEGYSAWGSNNAIAVSYDDPGVYRVNVQVRDSEGNQSLKTTNVTVLQSLLSNPGADSYNSFIQSSQIACDVDNNRIWAVNPDNNTVSEIDMTTMSVVSETATGNKPKSVVVTASDEIWVSNMKSDTITVFDRSNNVVETIRLNYGDAPYGIALNPEGTRAFVSLYGSGEVASFNTSTRDEIARTAVGPTPAAMAVSTNGEALLVTRFISNSNWGEVYHLDTSDLSLVSTIKLIKHYEDDTNSTGKGVPNYLSSIVFNNEGTKAYVVGKKDNVDRGQITLENLSGDDLDDDNTVRTILATIDLATDQDIFDIRFDLDNADSPSAVAFSPNAEYLFIALQGNNKVLAFNLINHDTVDESGDGVAGEVRTQFTSGLAPQALCMNPVNDTLYVKNFMDRSVTELNLNPFFVDGNFNPPSRTVSTVSSETLSEEVLLGKQVFYNAGDKRMSAEGYISCATCHIDGGHDGQTFDFTGRGEGLRNTTSLLGRQGMKFGMVHWSGNFDEIQDFEHDIRTAFFGEGFLSNEEFAATNDPDDASKPKAGLSPELDALAAYVSSLGKQSLPRSPHRTASGNLTAQGTSGRAVFEELECNSCHVGAAFTDGQIHDVGTLRSYSGNRLGAELVGLKTPSLLGLFDSAPYLHDGSAATIADVFSTIGGEVFQAENATLNDTENPRSPEYLRGSNGVAIKGNGSSSVTFENIDGGTGGLALLRFHYSGVESPSNRNLMISVNNTEAVAVELKLMPALHYRHGNHIESAAVSVVLEEGTSNTVEFSYPNGGDYTVTLDDLTVSNADQIQLADAHTRVITSDSVSDSDVLLLVQYVKQIDTSSASNDEADPLDTSAPDDSPEDPVVNPEPDTPSLPEPEPSPEPSQPSAPEEEEEETPVTSEPSTPQQSLVPGAESGGGGGSADWFMALLLLTAVGRRLLTNRR